MATANRPWAGATGRTGRVGPTGRAPGAGIPAGPAAMGHATGANAPRRRRPVGVDVPQWLVLALHGVQPNPTKGAVALSITLPTAAAVAVYMWDIAGRLVATHYLGSLGRGQHLVRLQETEGIPSGLYLLGLRQGGQSVVRRVVVTR